MPFPCKLARVRSPESRTEEMGSRHIIFTAVCDIIGVVVVNEIVRTACGLGLTRPLHVDLGFCAVNQHVVASK